MKQKFSKLFSLILAVILLLSSAVGIEAAADGETVINEVDLLNVPSPTVGAAATDYTYTYSESGTEVYTALGDWLVFNHDLNCYETMASTDTFVADKSYHLYITVTPATGYAFGDNNCTFKLDGNDFSDAHAHDNEGYVYLYFSGGTPIKKVTIDSDIFPKAEIGKAFDDTEDIKLTLPAGANYTASGFWHDEYGNSSGTFQDGTVYYFNYTITPTAGYCFDENTLFYIAGEDYGYSTSDDEQIFSNSHRVSFKTVIDTVELSNVPTVEVGKAIKASPDIKVPDGAKYSVSSAWWDDAEIGTSIDTDTTAQKNKLYNLNFYIIPDEGYEFAEYVILKLNGASHRVYTHHEGMNYIKEFDFRETIDRIEVTGVTKPIVGATPTTDGLKVADPDKYEITNAEWIDVSSGNPVAKFEDGHFYILQIEVTAKGDYWIAPYTKLLFNGEETTSNSNIEKNTHLHAEFNFMKSLDEVRVDNVPEFKIGASTPTDGIVTDLKVPDGANYSIAYARWYVLENGGYEDFSGVFQKGKYYCLSIQIEGKNGYKADSEQTVFYTNGSKVPSNRITHFWMGAGIDLFFGEDIKLIDRVELTVEKPVIGDHYSMLPVITAKNNTEYSVSEGSFCIIGNRDNYSQFYGYFSADNNNGVYIDLMAKDNYIFSEDLKVIINGKALSAEDFENSFALISIPYFYNEECAHFYTDANDETCDACGATRTVAKADTKSPKTGDNTTVLLLTAIIASGAVMIISKAKKANI